MTVRIVDHGANALLDAVKATAKVRVGIIGNKAVAGHRKSDENLTVAQVGAKHEFGIGNPKRSFIRAYHDQNIRFIEGLLRTAGLAVLEKQAVLKVELDKVGLHVENGIKDRIEAGIPPKNSQETIDRKGSEKQLIDTSQLINSITSESTNA